MVWGAGAAGEHGNSQHRSEVAVHDRHNDAPVVRDSDIEPRRAFSQVSQHVKHPGDTLAAPVSERRRVRLVGMEGVAGVIAPCCSHRSSPLRSPLLEIYGGSDENGMIGTGRKTASLRRRRAVRWITKIGDVWPPGTAQAGATVGGAMDDLQARIGQRIARARRRAGLTQQQFADLTGRSSSWVSKVERGDLPLDRHSVLAKIAEVLKVEVVELTGQPYRHETSELDSGHAAVPALRLALQHASLPSIGARVTRAPRPLSELRATVELCEQHRQAAQFAAVGDVLPDLIEDLLVASRIADDGQRDEIDELTLRACHIARVTSNLLGHHDLAWIAVQLQLGAAQRSGSPALLAAAAWDLCGVWLHAGSLPDATAVATTAIDDLDDVAGGDDETLLALYGALHLRAAVAFSRSFRTPAAREHIAAAREIAERVSLPNAFQTMFGTVNVGIHATEVELELGRPADVLREAAAVDPAQIDSAERQAHYWVVRAVGYAMNRKDDEALKALAMADRTAPQHVRNRPMARELVRDLLERERSRSDHLRTLAARMGVA